MEIIAKNKYFTVLSCTHCGRRFTRHTCDLTSKNPMCSRECWWKSDARKTATKKNLHTKEVRKKIAIAESGVNNFWYGKRGVDTSSWKGKDASYFAFHMWLRKTYGPANKCEGKSKRRGHRFPKRFEYALIHGKEHDHKRENYKMLCCSCHRIYDNIRPIWAK